MLVLRDDRERMTGSSARVHELLDLTVPADEFAPRSARRAIGSLRLPAGTAREDAILLTSELVANAIRHAGLLPAVVEVRAFKRGGRLRIEVSNRVGDLAADRERQGWDVDRVEPAAASGWGLRLVDLLATRWGTVHQAGRTTVWFEIGSPGSGGTAQPRG